MISYPVPANEAERLDVLSRLGLIGSAKAPEFDAVVSLVRTLFQVPIALVSLLDQHQQWFMGCEGLNVRSTDRESSFCNYAVASGELFVVNDAATDERFNRNPLVTGEPNIRFYAGAPVWIAPGVALGALCIIDTRPRRLTSGQSEQLCSLAGVVGALLRQIRDARAVADLVRSLGRSKDLFERASSLARMGAWEWTLETDELTWSDEMYDIHEIPRGTPITRPQALRFYPEGVRDEVEKLSADSSDGRQFLLEAPIRTAKGKQRWVRLAGSAESRDGVVVRRFGMKQDITEQKAVLDRVQFLAECDPLTKLANRTTFQARLEALTKDPHGRRPTLLLIDIDGFKHINDTFGHAIGDECLKKIAKRLKRDDHPGLVARLGGDEFAILLESPDPEVVGACIRNALASARRPLRWRSRSFQLSASIGIATLSSKAKHASDFFAEADLALYAAKAAGRNTFRFFTQDMRQKANERFETVRNITRALARNELELFYQPKINLSKGDELAGFEALLRWRRPDGQVVAAGAFSAALEDPELSDRLGEWVIGEALRQAQAWHEAGLDFRHVAINLSSGQFREPDFGDRLIRQIAAHGLQPRMIEVEVTEGVFLNHEADNVSIILRTLQGAGVRIALDDFGTGFASLTHLRTFPVDIIKIDRTFVQHFLTSFQDHAILQSTLFLARHLKLDVVAEGIEEADQCEFLKALGCRFGQGWLFSKAICAAEAAEWCGPKSRMQNVA